MRIYIVVCLCACTHIYRPIGQVGKMFTKGLWGRGSIPGWVIQKTQKMVLDTSLLNTQDYKVLFKSKVEQYGVEAYEKGAFGLLSTSVANFTYTHTHTHTHTHSMVKMVELFRCRSEILCRTCTCKNNSYFVNNKTNYANENSYFE